MPLRIIVPVELHYNLRSAIDRLDVSPELKYNYSSILFFSMLLGNTK